jgi:hypothetical protein
VELQLRHAPLDAGHVAGQGFEGVVVALAAGEREELGGVPQPGIDRFQRGDRRIQRGALLAQILRTLGVVPDAGILQGARYLYEPRFLRVVVKDTSATLRP